jgi:hypothetical protein
MEETREQPLFQHAIKMGTNCWWYQYCFDGIAIMYAIDYAITGATGN